MNSNRTNQEGDKHVNTDKFVGLDVHKDAIVAAIAESGCEGEVRLYGTIASELGTLEKLLRKLGARACACTWSTKRGRPAT